MRKIITKFGQNTTARFRMNESNPRVTRPRSRNCIDQAVTERREPPQFLFYIGHPVTYMMKARASLGYEAAEH
jgi:hypothetical protein